MVHAEPALRAVKDKLFGSLRLPNDETGDCQLFTLRLAKMAEALGVKFRYNVGVDSLAVAGGAILGVNCGAESVQADAYVVALGAYSSRVLKPIVGIPVYPLERIFDHSAYRRRQSSAKFDHSGRNLQDRCDSV